MDSLTPSSTSHCTAVDHLAIWIKAQAHSLGFTHVGISRPNLSQAKERYLTWLSKGWQGDMTYMTRNIDIRFSPQQIVPETLSVISVAMPYLAPELDEDWRKQAWTTLNTSQKASISRYALGRDYHKVVRSRLQNLANDISTYIAPSQLIYRAFSDSAPIPEVEIAQQSTLGWRGKHTLLLNHRAGSMFFLGELYINLPLQPDKSNTSHCGSCRACIDICPTQAIIAPYQLDARRCISYLTIEYQGKIPHEFRKAIGNRIYGCDDCQLICPWNKFAQKSTLSDFAVRNDLHSATLLELLLWTEDVFKEKMAGSAIYRIGHSQWQRNILLALGNSPYHEKSVNMLRKFTTHSSSILAEQADWSLRQQLQSAHSVPKKTNTP